MHQLFKKIIAFVFLGTGTYLLIYVVVLNLMNYYGSFKFPTPKTRVIFGHSHPEFAYDERAIDSFANLAQAGEAYFYTQVKLKKILAHNPEIKEVWIEFSANQIIPRMEEWMYGEMYLHHRLPIFAPFMSLEDHFFLLTHNFWSYLTATPLTIKKNLTKILTQDFEMLPEVKANPNIWIDGATSSITPILPTKAPCEQQTITFPVSTNHIHYLQSMVKEVKAKGKAVRLIRSPNHENAYSHCIEKEYQEVRNKYFKQVIWVDLLHFPIEGNAWLDAEHLKHEGALKASTRLKEIMLEDLQTENDN